jgi:hypothetical protein
MPPERPRPDFEQVREAMRERDERSELPEQPEPPPPAEDEDRERDEDDEDESGSG